MRWRGAAVGGSVMHAPLANFDGSTGRAAFDVAGATPACTVAGAAIGTGAAAAAGAAVRRTTRVASELHAAHIQTTTGSHKTTLLRVLADGMLRTNRWGPISVEGTSVARRFPAWRPVERRNL